MAENGSDTWYTLVPPFTPPNSVNTSVFRHKNLEGRIVVGVTCCLSIIGASLILLSYFLQKKRTKAKHIIFHISLMDLGVSLANVIGLSVYFDKYFLVNSDATHVYVKPYIDGLCKAQAFFAAFFSMGSVLWTTALAAYLYVVIIHSKKPKLAQYVFYANFIICYGLITVLSLWTVLTGKLGYAPYDAPGWCSLITIDPLDTDKKYVFNAVLYDMWIYISAFLIIIIYIALKCYVSVEARRVQKSYQITSKKFWSSLNHIDYKFIFIPVIFVLLRVWGMIEDILYVYVGLSDKQIPPAVNVILLFLSGVGDSAQGFTNAILFILFTKNARNKFVRYLCCKCKEPEEDTTSNATNPTYSSIQTTSQYDDDDDDNDYDPKPSYVAALLQDSDKIDSDNKSQPV